MTRMRRRSLLLASALAPLAACRLDAPDAAWRGGWIGADVARGHRVRDTKSGEVPMPAVQRRCGVIVVGAGIAGLGAARTLTQAGIDDVHLFDLEAVAGGNSRGHQIAGIACPLGAHYLPLPGPDALEVVELLDELGLRRSESGRPVYDERNLCHSPQERLWIEGRWHDGLLPPVDALPAAQRAVTQAEYRRFEAAVAQAALGHGYTLPTARAVWTPAHAALDRVTFAQWLDAERYAAPALRWYLDYCCRDDYGAGAAQVSAWAGLHYFASRHGFHAPGDGAAEHDDVLTWPEGNAWLSRRLAVPLGARLHPSMVALRIGENRHDASVDFWNAVEQKIERWTAAQVVLALPLFIASRLLAAPPAALVEASAAMRHAPWLVANLHLDRALDDRPGAAPSWDNVVYRSPTLGYVDATHQSLLPYAGATVLTAYWALGGDSAAELAVQRLRLLDAPWSAWADAVVQDLAVAHPDLAAKLQRVDLMRYGHAMSIPLPGVRGSAALLALAGAQPRVQFGHADLSGYSVFEEALYQGARAGRAALDALRSRSARSTSRTRPGTSS
ncbi:MAG: FAD-dependent oxidoreductase [Caldimonas sp.]